MKLTKSDLLKSVIIGACLSGLVSTISLILTALHFSSDEKLTYAAANVGPWQVGEIYRAIENVGTKIQIVMSGELLYITVVCIIFALVSRFTIYLAKVR